MAQLLVTSGEFYAGFLVPFKLAFNDQIYNNTLIVLFSL